MGVPTPGGEPESVAQRAVWASPLLFVSLLHPVYNRAETT
jgi:hypothetical protein